MSHLSLSSLDDGLISPVYHGEGEGVVLTVKQHRHKQKEKADAKTPAIT